MPYRPLKRRALPPDPLKKLFLADVVRYQGNLDSMRMGHKVTRRQINADLWWILSAVVLMLWGVIETMVVRQGNAESRLGELERKPVQRERGRANAAGNGGFAA